MTRNDKNIYTYFHYDRDSIDCVFAIAPTFMQNILIKQWGPYLIKKTYVKLSASEEQIWNQSINWFEDHLMKVHELREKGLTLKEIKMYLQESLNPSKSSKTALYDTITTFINHYDLTKKELESILKLAPPQSSLLFQEVYEEQKEQLSKREILDSIAKRHHIAIAHVLAAIQIVNRYAEQMQIEKRMHNLKEKNQKAIYRVYKSKEELLTRNNMSEKELDALVEDLPKNERASVIYTLGLYGRSQLSIQKLARVLDIPSENVQSYVNSFFRKVEWIANEKMSMQETQREEPTVPKAKTNTETGSHLKVYAKGRHPKKSMYEGFDKEDYPYVTKAIENWEKTKLNYYQLIVKVYGETYDTFNKEAYLQLTKKERKRLQNICNTLLRRQIIMLKKEAESPTYVAIGGNQPKKSMYEGFDKEDYPYVTKVIENWKKINLNYYQLIVKIYGETYDTFNKEAYLQLTTKERKMFQNIHSNLKKRVLTQKKNAESSIYIAPNGKAVKQSMYEGYAEEDYKYVTEIIENWKETNPKYYALIVRIYGETYDTFHKEEYSKLTKEESSLLRNIHGNLKLMVRYREKRAGNTIEIAQNGRKIKQSIYEGYAEEDYKYVTEIIEDWKETNPKYYTLIVRIYGETYDTLQKEEYRKLTKEEKNLLRRIHNNLKVRVRYQKQVAESTIYVAQNGRKIKQSMYEGYAKEDYKYVTEVIENWKETNPKYYTLIVRIYGKTYDILQKEEYRKLTKEERDMFRNIHSNLKRHVRKKKWTLKKRFDVTQNNKNIESVDRNATDGTYTVKSQESENTFSNETFETKKQIYKQMYDLNHKVDVWNDKATLIKMKNLLCYLYDPIDEEMISNQKTKH